MGFHEELCFISIGIGIGIIHCDSDQGDYRLYEKNNHIIKYPFEVNRANSGWQAVRRGVKEGK